MDDDGLEAALAEIEGDIDATVRALATALREAKKAKAAVASGQLRELRQGLAAAARLNLCRDRPEQAARLFAAADTLRSAIHVPLPPPERPEYDRAVAVVRTILGDAAFEAAWRDGAVLPLETALAAANALAASQ